MFVSARSASNKYYNERIRIWCFYKFLSITLSKIGVPALRHMLICQFSNKDDLI